MKKRIWSTIGVFLTQVVLGCATNNENLLLDGTVTIEEEAVVTNVQVIERDDKTRVTGRVIVFPHTERHLDGMLHLDVIDPEKQVLEHHEICFKSVLEKPGYRVPSVQKSPEFEVILSERPEEGSTLHFWAELENPRCMEQHTQAAS